jgi:hypothetical protein
MKTTSGSHIYTGQQYSAMAQATALWQAHLAQHPGADRETWMAGYFAATRNFVSAR